MKHALICVLIVLPVVLCGCNSEAAAHLELGKFEYEAGNHEEAIVEFKKCIAIDSDNGEAYYFLACSYEMQEHYQGAIAAYKKAIALRPNFHEQYVMLGEIYQKVGMNAEALDAYKEYIALEPTGTSADDARERISEIESRD